MRYAPQEKCEIACKKEKLCNLVTSNSKDITPKSIECKEIERIVDQYHETKNKKVLINFTKSQLESYNLQRVYS